MFSFRPERQAGEQTRELSVIGNVLMLMERHCNAQLITTKNAYS